MCKDRGDPKPCAMAGRVLLLFSMFWFVMLWRRFVIFCLGVLCMCTYVMHSPNVMLSTLREFPGLAGFTSPPSFK